MCSLVRPDHFNESATVYVWNILERGLLNSQGPGSPSKQNATPLSVLTLLLTRIEPATLTRL